MTWRSFIATCLTSIVAVVSHSASAQGSFTLPEVNTQTNAQAPDAVTLGGAAAIVNDEVISISDVAQRARYLMIERNLPQTQEVMAQAMPVALEQLIDERLQLQKAAEYEVEIDQQSIDQALQDRAARSGITIETLFQTLESIGIRREALESQVRAEIAWRRIMSGLYSPRIRISQVQIDDMLRRMKSEAQKPSYQLSEIFLFAPSDADKQAILANTQQMIQQLQGGEVPFGLVAQRFSQAPTAAAGGDMGWVSPDELDPAVAEALAKATPPALVGPIAAADGFYIYAFQGRREPAAQTDPVVTVKQLVLMEGRDAALRNALEDVGGCSGSGKPKNENVIFADLGKLKVADLSDEVRPIVAATATGSASKIFETSLGKSIVLVCERSDSNLELPPRDAIEDRLYSQQLAMLSDRTLRDMKREATIIRR